MFSRIMTYCFLYVLSLMSEGVVHQWVRFFKNGRTNIHNEERSDRPSLQSEWKSSWDPSLHNLETFPSFSWNISESFTQDNDRKTRLPHFALIAHQNCLLITTKQKEWILPLTFFFSITLKEKNFWTELLLAMRFGLPMWILRQNSSQCNRDISLHQTSQSLSKFVSEESYNYGVLGC